MRFVDRRLAVVIALLVSVTAIHPAPVHAAGRGPADAAELEAFLDRVVPDAMQEWHVPGAVILVVQNDTVFLQKGYGYADVAKQIRMSPETTVLRVFSLSKLFTATAVMQLVEQQQIDLDKDVNTYLRKLRIENPYGGPITIRHLLTHTAGFDSDQREIGGSAKTSAEWLSLEPYLAKRTLTPMWPPGQQFLYTNAAYDVLGLAVEDVSGRPFAEYMSERILKPLSMTRSTFQQTPSLGSDVAVTYRSTMGQQTIVPDGLLLNVPAAGLTSTASDMARFMVAQLEHGQYGEARILQPATLEDMHQQRFSYEPNQPGATFGFREAFSPRTSNGFREDSSRHLVLWHAGGGPSAPSSYMQLQTEQRFGLFMAFNTDEYRFLDQVLREFNDHYDPLVSGSSLAAAPRRAASGGEDLSHFTGTYRVNDYSHHTISKLLLLQEDDLPQVVTSADSLGIRWLPDAPDQPEPLVRLDPRVFASRDGQFRFTFLQDGNNAITGMVWGNLFVMEKVPWYETAGFHRSLFAMFLLVFLAAAVAWPAIGLVRLLRSRADAHTTATAAGRIGSLAVAEVSAHAVLGSLLLLGLLYLLPRAFDLGLQFGMPPVLTALRAIPILATALAVGLVGLAIPVLHSRAWSGLVRLGYCLYTVCAVAFVPFLLYWNLLGQRW